MYKILYLKNERNDATDYYVGIIEKSLISKGFSVQIITELKQIEKKDKVLTITLKAFLFVWLRNPKQFIIHWFQGVTPEEVLMLFSSKYITKTKKYFYLTLIERLVLKVSKFNFFVSLAMHKHYEEKYNYKSNNFMIMPCYNQHLNNNAFVDDKYETPNFVYAGSLAKWQCIEKTLMIFKKVNEKIPESKMYIYTSEKEKAYQLIEKYNMRNIFVDYVPYEILNKKIQGFKYGFLIRDDVIVNQVATPTKMNGYLANGVIPIYSNIINDFQINLKGDFLLNVDDLDDAVHKIVKFESLNIRSIDVKEEYSKFFDEYYFDEYYILKIQNKFSDFNVV